MTLTLDRPALLVPPVDGDATRRGFLTGGVSLAALLATGCASGELPRGTTRTRTVSTDFGAVEIPTDPTRLLAFNAHDLDNALVLGLPLVGGGADDIASSTPFQRYQTEAHPQEMADVTPIFYREPDFEQIAALRPDVILAGPWEREALQEVAPTLSYQYYDQADPDAGVVVPWQGVFRSNASWFDREDEAEAFLTAHEERTAALREAVAATWAGGKWAIVEPYAGSFWLYSTATGGHTALVLEALGLVENSFVTDPGFVAQEFSLEVLPEVDADLVLLSTGADRTSVTQLTSNPLWSSIPGVAAGQVHEFEGVMTYESALAATTFLGVLETALLP